MASSSIFLFDLIGNTWTSIQRVNNPQGTLFGALVSGNDANSGLPSLVAFGGFAPLASGNEMGLGDASFSSLKVKSTFIFYF